jgi:hypothetical protein
MDGESHPARFKLTRQYLDVRGYRGRFKCMACHKLRSIAHIFIHLPRALEWNPKVTAAREQNRDKLAGISAIVHR